MTTALLLAGMGLAIVCRAQVPDTTCSGMCIDHIPSVKFVAGAKAWTKLITNTTEFPYLILRNASNSQQVVLIQHYGNPDYNVSEFRVSYVLKDDTNHRYIHTNIKNFGSGKKITLGMDMEAVQKCWDSPGKVYKSNTKTILQYRIAGRSSSYMRRHAKTSYYATYIFYNDRLIEFSYGFDYE